MPASNTHRRAGTSSSPSGPFPLGRLLILTGAVFAANTTEFLPAGVLPEIASDLQVSEAQVGYLVAAFAIALAVSTLPLTALTRALPRKSLIVALLLGLALTNFACALAPSYGFLLAARIFGGMCHGLFWSVATPYPSYLVGMRLRARALTLVNAGSTIGLFLGVPLGTAIGVAFGWRLAFASLGVVVFVFALLAIFLLPSAPNRSPMAAERSVSVLQDRTLPRVMAVAGIVLFAALGQSSFYTYVAPWLRGPANISGELVSLMLFFFGLAAAAGLAIAGVAGDRNLDATLIATLVATAGSVILLYFFAHGVVLVALLIAVWGAAFAGFPPLVQTMALNESSPRLHDSAGGIIAVAFNIAISLGALIGGGVIDQINVSALPWSQLIFTLAALALACVVVVQRRRASRNVSTASPHPTAPANASAPDPGDAQ